MIVYHIYWKTHLHPLNSSSSGKKELFHAFRYRIFASQIFEQVSGSIDMASREFTFATFNAQGRVYDYQAGNSLWTEIKVTTLIHIYYNFNSLLIHPYQECPEDWEEYVLNNIYNNNTSNKNTGGTKH